MKKYICTFPLLLLLSICLRAQNEIADVLQHIETNNKTLRAENELNKARKLEARTGNYLANPTVELNQLWADGSAGGNVNELAVVQSLDFPTVYSHKNKIAGLRAATSDYQFAASRQQILLSAQQICQEIIYLRKQKKLLEERFQNASSLFNLYEKRLEGGDANQLEFNKIQLEQLNTRNEMRLNQTALKAALQQLQNLNGGIPVEFTAEDYPEIVALPGFAQIESEYMAADPALKDLSGQSEIAEREIRLTRAQSLPKFDIGYRRNGGSEEKLNGFRIGMSIPLWENKNTVKRAKAQFEYTTALLEDKQQTVKSNLQQLYEQAEALQLSRSEYQQILSGQHSTELLNKALQAGQISMIDYFIEITTLYESRQNYLNVERDYFNTVAQLFQYKL